MIHNLTNHPPIFVFQEGEEMDDNNPDFVNSEELEADPPANAVKYPLYSYMVKY